MLLRSNSQDCTKYSSARKKRAGMRRYSIPKIWFTALLLLSTITGCGDPDKNAVPTPPTTSPTVTLVTPANGNTGLCSTTTIISATFSKAMNPATITTSTFTVMAPGGANVAGAVSYAAATNIATFTPSSALALNTAFTATITTGAADTFGNRLAANFVWTFTTGAACPPPPAVFSLGTACSFGILAATPSVTSAGPTAVTGDIGIFPAASIVGFPAGTLTGTKHAGDAVAQTAQGDLTTAYNNAAAAAGGAVLPADIGGLPAAFPAGVYRTTSAQPSLGITGNLTLDGGGNPNAVWIFQIVSTLTTAANNSHMILINSANAHNVFWQVGSSATLGSNTIFQGTMMAQASITLTTGATLNGRALARTGAVTLDSNPVNVPPCP